MEQKSKYVAPSTQRVTVELEQGFMTASVFDKDDGHDKGLQTEEHGFANPNQGWEGDYGDDTWD